MSVPFQELECLRIAMVGRDLRVAAGGVVIAANRIKLRQRSVQVF